jgi:hypothetical protein
MFLKALHLPYINIATGVLNLPLLCSLPQIPFAGDDSSCGIL